LTALLHLSYNHGLKGIEAAMRPKWDLKKTGWVLVGALVLFIATPMGWVFSFSPVLRRLFNDVFYAEWVHVAAHIILFSLLGFGFNWARGRAGRGPALALTIGLALGVGLVQEILQMISRGHPFGAASLYDLVVDSVGAALGYAAYRVRQRWARR